MDKAIEQIERLRAALCTIHNQVDEVVVWATPWTVLVDGHRLNARLSLENAIAWRKALEAQFPQAHLAIGWAQVYE